MARYRDKIESTNFKSGMEKRYAGLLEMRLLGREILRWEYEPVGFRLADNTFYYPDFFVVTKDALEFHETKGWDRQGKGKLKWKSTADKYNEFVWRYITWEKRQWKIITY